jgi:hypothetical protein
MLEGRPKFQIPNPKSQIPGTKEIPIPKSNQVGRDLWNLGFGNSLELGIWDLEFFLDVREGLGRQRLPNRRVPLHPVPQILRDQLNQRGP